MKPDELKRVLQQVQNRELPVDAALDRLKDLPFEDLGFARLDHHRELRTGLPEVVFGESKSAEHIAKIVEKISERNQTALVTRVSQDKGREVLQRLGKDARARTIYEEVPGLIVAGKPMKAQCLGTIAVVTAGTSDQRVAEEAARTSEILGHPVERFYDVGVAGLHRIASVREKLERSQVVVCVAGMEGALPSVVKGLISRPVIAVPTSIGFGVHFGGITALLGMLSSCAPGITVVNIDNGFGAGYAATLINNEHQP